MTQKTESLSNTAQLHGEKEIEKVHISHVVTMHNQAQHWDRNDHAAFLQQLIDLIPLGIVVHLNGSIVMANPAALSIMGAKGEEDWFGRQVLDFVHEDSRAQAIERIQRLLSDSTEEEFTIAPFVEETFLTVDGEPFDAEVAGIRMAPTEEGTPILVLFRDITEQKQQRRALEESESRFRRLVSVLPEGIIIHKNKEIVFVNQAFVDMMRVSGPEELIGRSMGDFLLSEEEPFIEKRIQRLLTTWEALPLSRNHIRRPNGEVFLVEVQAFPFMEQGEKAILLVVRDVTEMEQMRAELAKNEAKFRLLSELLPALVYMVDEDGQLQYLNRYIFDALGYTFEDLRTKDFSTIVNHEDLEHARNIFDAMAIGESARYELRVFDKAGDQRWMAVWTTKTIMDDRVVGLGVAMDMTWRKEMEQALKEHAHHLVTALEEERRRIASELHDEVGQQLIGMKFVMERALHHAREPQVRRAIQDALHQLSDLTEQVRELSLSFRPAMLDSLGLLHTLLWHFNRYSERTGIHVRFYQSGLEDADIPQPLAITAYRVIQESLTNVARHAQVDEVFVEVRVADQRLIISVVDKGVGFDPKKALQNYESSGLKGMKERVSLLAGELSIYSKPWQGTTILAIIPLQPSTQAV